MKSLVKILLIFTICLFLSLASFSQIYKWRDQDGNLIVSTTPPPPGIEAEVREIEKRKDDTDQEPSTRFVMDPEFRTKKPYSNVKVILYTTDWCPVCDRARNYLKKLRVNLTEYDVEKDPGKSKERLEKTNGKTGVPVIDVEGIILIGFSEASVNKAVEKKRII